MELIGETRKGRLLRLSIQLAQRGNTDPNSQSCRYVEIGRTNVETITIIFNIEIS